MSQQISQRTKARVRQQAIRSMCYGPDGKLHKNARVVMAHLRDFCGATNLGVTIGTLSGWLGRRATKAEVRALSADPQTCGLT